MLTTIIIYSVVVCCIIYYIRFWFQVHFNVHKRMNSILHLDMSEHNDLNRFLEEFQQIKSELVPSRNTKVYDGSLFHNDFIKDFENSMNGQLFRINNVRYVAKNFSDYQKAVKVIRDHYNYCEKNNIYSEWI